MYTSLYYIHSKVIHYSLLGSSVHERPWGKNNKERGWCVPQGPPKFQPGDQQQKGSYPSNLMAAQRV